MAYLRYKDFQRTVFLLISYRCLRKCSGTFTNPILFEVYIIFSFSEFMAHSLHSKKDFIDTRLARSYVLGRKIIQLRNSTNFIISMVLIEKYYWQHSSHAESSILFYSIYIHISYIVFLYSWNTVLSISISR